MKLTLTILLFSVVGIGTGSNISNVRSKREIKSSGLLGGSFYSLCEPPSAPRNGGLTCSSSSRRMSCTAACLAGFTFPDGATELNHVCSVYDGIWTPDMRFPDCEPICDPPCQNGGHCFGHNKCVCAPGFRGDYCQFSVANCDGNDFFTGNWACNHTNKETVCTVSCPPGMQFDYTPASIYTCDLYGSWNPASVPKCHAVDVIIRSSSQPLISPTIITNPNSKIAYSLISGSKKNGVCSTWSQLHYRTFGGSMFSFQGKCAYLLARDCASDTFSIRVKNDPFCNGVYNCQRQVIIDANNRRYTLESTIEGPQFFVGNEVMKFPCTAGGMVVEQIGHYIVIESALGFKLGWDGKDGIFVEVQRDLQNSTCGLCGRIDTSGLVRDLELIDGSITTSIVTFANSWKMNDLGDYCPDILSFDHHCKYDWSENQKISDKADEVCQRLLNVEYATCHSILDPHPYFEMCRMDFCGCGDADNHKCICSTLASYFHECYRLGGKLPRSWRKEDFCALECSSGLTYNDCGSSCPETCKKGVQECSSDNCVEGCFCPLGTVLHEGKCIQKEQCPCYHNGKAYSTGETIFQDCNACMCEQSRWECTNDKCEGRCSAVGDPHYTTFDGRNYDFMGKCSYYLMFSKDYSIEQENIACSGAISEKLGFVISPSNKYPSCTKSIIIRIRDTVLHLKQRLEVTVNGKETTELPISAPGVYVYVVSSLYIKAELENGLVVMWDGASRVYIDAPPTFYDRTMGLCGTFNHNQKDDYLTTDGDIEQDVNAFANKWKTSESCKDISLGQVLQDPCELFPHRREEAQKLCAQLKSSAFSSCHNVLDYEPFYRDCLYDMCHCQTRMEDCLCPILADYGVKCSKRRQTVDWRMHIRECGISCPGDQVYQVCGSSCKRSCVDIAYHTKCREECVEGCNCLPGTTLNRYGECIPISECQCVHGGNNFDPGYLDIRGNMTCACSNAVWACRPATAEELTDYHSSDMILKPLCSDAANMESTDCAPECVKTCKNMHSPPTCKSQMCKPGCRCKKGYVMDTKSERCVKEHECPCHHGGQSYSEGDTIKEDCNTCVCEGGVWSCEKKECPAICQAWGSSHFKTFDGKMYEFHGDCDYVLARGGEEKYNKFSIIIRNVLCGTSDMTCSKTVIFQIADEKVTLNSERPNSKMVYGSRFIMREVGLFVFIHTDVGLTLQWDKGTRIYLRADVRWKTKIEGLCGNFNGDESDDFETPDGGLAVVLPSTFGDSWRLREYCPVSKVVNDTCDLHPNRKSWALKQCGILKSALFRRCHSEVPVEPYLERCVFDSCGCDMGGDCECLCTALAAYAQECSRNGIVIKWRSQSLCPIQCEECAEYSGCISVCPKLTCETEFLYESIETLCGNEACVEGCEPKPCPLGQKYNNPKDWKCIPESDCLKLQPCKVIKGETYYEGQRISNPDFSDPCESCFCRGGKIVCVGKKCPVETTVKPIITTETPVSSTTLSSTTTAYVEAATCDKHGWTEWMNGFTPTLKNGGDYETLDLLRKRQFSFCPLENILHIECRSAITHKNYKEVGQNVWCSLPEGLKCINKDQASFKLCQDYEIRLFCQCAPNVTEETTPAYTTSSPTPYPETCTETGWTAWMNTREPNIDGEFELIPELRKHYEFCGVHDIGGVECRPVNSLTTEYLSGVECTSDRGLVCRNSKDHFCPDYEIRFHCICEKKGCPMPLGIESGAISDQQISVSSYQTPATLGHHGRLKGFSAWSAGDVQQPQWIEIDFKDVKEVSGIITQGHPYKNEWVSAYKLLYSNDGKNWKEIFKDDKEQIFVGNYDRDNPVTSKLNTPIYAQFIRLVPIEWNEWISLRLEILGCDIVATTTAPSLTTEIVTEITSTVGTPFPYKCIHGWTQWMNIDSPKSSHPNEIASGNSGDLELAAEHHYFHSFCAYPSTVECRVVGSEIMSHLTSEKTKCDLDGLLCRNHDQESGICSDYEVRYYCDCEETTTEATTTVPPTLSCSTGWTDWMNSNNPKSNSLGDIEDFRSLRTKYNFCMDEAVKAVECRVAGSDISFNEAGQLGVRCDINLGLQCLHDLQKLGVCKDFEIRFYCLCERETTYTSTPSSVPTKTYENVTEYTVTSGIITIEPPEMICDAWSQWFNMDTPYDDGIDSELLRRIPNFKEKCFKPVSFQCRDAFTWQNFEQTGQHFKERCNEKGIVCESNGQQCSDYEIRYTIIGPSSPTTPEPPCHHGWTTWFDIDDPYVGEGDFELIEEIRLKHELCSKEYITDIQCEARSLSVGGKLKLPPAGKGGAKTFGKNYGGKTSGGKTSGSKTSGKGGGSPLSPLKSGSSGWLDFTETGDIGVKCTATNGLSCYNSLQMKNRKCRDYRVRFYCTCGTTTVSTSPATEPTTIIPEITTHGIITEVCGWSSWLNSHNPENGNFEFGDSESIQSIQEEHRICKGENIKDIECRIVDTHTPWFISSQSGLTCDIRHGFKCESRLQIGGCYDYEVRVLCIPPDCDYEFTSTAAPTTSTTPPCLPGKVWHDCAYQCDNMCHSFLYRNIYNNLCNENVTCVPGCIFEECEPPKVWRDETSCVKPEECTCISDAGQLLAPGEVIVVSECYHCQCIGNELQCEEPQSCKTTEATTTEATTTEATTTEIATTEFEPCWTAWFNTDSPDNDQNNDGDIEDIKAIRMKYDFCENPTKIQCRNAKTYALFDESKEYGECDLHVGFLCWDKMNWKTNGCHDYEVRFYCPCEEAEIPTTVETTLETTIKSEEYCKEGFTDWFNLHTPDNFGEREDIKSIRQAGISVCGDEFLTTIECRVKGTDIPFYESEDRNIACNLREGFYCENRRQHRRNCNDYEVRFYCHCGEEESTTTEIIPVSTTERPTCEYWSDWINEDKPWIGVGDIENLNKVKGFCQEGVIEAIECVQADSNVPAHETTGSHLTCSVAKGFSCLNKHQSNGMCDDYKVRYFCACAVVTLPPVELCPELPIEIRENCPTTCPPNEVCDGHNCVDAIHCPCNHNGKHFKVGEMIETSDCKECICKLNGHSYCYDKSCPKCYYGVEGTLNENCTCQCKTCPTGEILCQSDLQCLSESRWCDGIFDCHDDEVDCPTTPPPETTTTPITTTPCPEAELITCKQGYVAVLSNPNDLCPKYVCEKLIGPTESLPLERKYSCTLSSNILNTFDGFEYSYEICDHVLVQDKVQKRFNITVHKSCENMGKGCSRSLIISQGKHQIKLEEHKVIFDGKTYDAAQLIRLGKKRTDLSVKYVGDAIIAKSKTYDIGIIWDKSSNVEIEVTSVWKMNLVGLCGYFNSNPDDDKMTPNGEEVDAINEFGDSWSLGSPEQCTPAVCPAHILAEAQAACNQLKFSPFDVCNEVVDPTHHINVCIASVCECILASNSSDKDCRCKAYLPYVEACEMKNVIKIRYWRMKQSCLPSCPMGLVWQDCGSVCERTCENMVELHESDVCPEDRCVAGCFCPIGLVRKGDHCVKPEKCEDCVCKGYGDPHYFTYDGSYFPFQGNCTYILSRDIIPKETPNASHKFEVYATNEDCHEEPMTTCTVAIMILYNGHIAYFRVNESVTFDGVQLYPSDLPFHAYGIHIESIPGRSVTFSVFEIHLVVRYFELNYGFEIRLPSEVYYNKTEGLCGNCNFNSSDDFLCKDGKLTNDTNEFGLSWIAEPPEGFESVNEICKLKEEIKTCRPSIELEMCEKLLQDIFTPCHALVDPELYLASCRFDMCHSVSPISSLCRAATEYTRKCAELGICIEDWRTKDFCPYECPPGMHFKQCGSACPKSCKDVVNSDWQQHKEPDGKDTAPLHLWSLEQTLQELSDVCDTTAIDGCFCHSSKVLKDGLCVDPIICESCDDEGHKVGDSWQVNPCTSCACTIKVKVECVTTKCPSALICTSDEELKTIPANNETCCDAHECVPKNIIPICPQTDEMPHCKTGEVIKVHPNTETSCPEYYCECDVFHCPPIQSKMDLDVGEETKIVKKGCCHEIEVICNPDKCPEKPICQKFHELKERKPSTSKCCSEFYCEMTPNVCVYVHQFEVVNGRQKLYDHDILHENIYKPGEIWMDGLCRNCSCESSHGQYKQKCVVELCPRLNDYKDKDDYVWKTELVPHVCCPKFTKQLCVYKGQNRSIGEEWRSDENRCKHYRCDKNPNGEAVKIERFITCDETCKAGFEYFGPPESSPDCCGMCKPVACIEDGQWYKIGSVWNSTSQKCFTGECLADGDALQTRFSGPVCPSMPVDCLKKSLDTNGCCEVCLQVRPPSNLHVCRPEKLPPQQTIEMFELFHGNTRCTNKFAIHDMKACAGNCASTSVFSAGHHDFVSNCNCCTPTKVEKKTVSLECTDGVSKPIEYSEPTECECTECAGGSPEQHAAQSSQMAHEVFKRK